MSETSFVEYRNALYQGGFVKGKREGKGILITDSGQIFIGNWKNDSLDGQALIWIDEKTHVTGEFKLGQMDGQFIYKDTKRVFYAVFSNDRLGGKLLNIDRVQQRARLMEYKNLSYQILQDENILGIRDNQVFQQMLGFKVQMPSLNDFIQQQMLSDETYEVKILNTGGSYIGFKKGLSVQKLGFVMSKEELVSFGVYKQTALDGLGCEFANKIRYQGVFKNGLLNGLGLKYQILQKKGIIGNFVNGNMNEIEETGKQVGKTPDLSQMKRSIHLRSMYFFNSFVQANSILKYSGYQETASKSSPQQEHTSPEAPKKKKSQVFNKDNSPKLTPKSSTKDTPKEVPEGQTSPLNKSRKKNEDEPQLRGVNTLLNKLQGKNSPGSLNSHLREYEELEALRKKQGKKDV